MEGYPKEFRGVTIDRIPVSDVKVGDKIACWLSDASAYPTVTGWTDKTIDLTRYDLGVTVHRHFKTSDAPWWAVVPSAHTDVDDLTFDVTATLCIVAREAA